eukprot:1751980-Alexandrium_andersonii.AAC.1
MAVGDKPGADHRRRGASRPRESERRARACPASDVRVLANPELASVRHGGEAPRDRPQGTKKAR